MCASDTSGTHADSGTKCTSTESGTSGTYTESGTECTSTESGTSGTYTESGTECTSTESGTSGTYTGTHAGTESVDNSGTGVGENRSVVRQSTLDYTRLGCSGVGCVEQGATAPCLKRS